MKQIVIFTDMETDDVLAITMLMQMCVQCIITLVIGGSNNVPFKLSLAHKMFHGATIVPGLPSSATYPVWGDLPPVMDEAYDINQVKTVLKQANVVVLLKPPHELLEMREEVFPNAECWLSGSFNLRSCWKRIDREELPKLLMRMFPKKLVWVESFTAIGERNSVQSIEVMLPPSWHHQVRDNFNCHLVKQCIDGILGPRCRPHLTLEQINVMEHCRSCEHFTHLFSAILNCAMCTWGFGEIRRLYEKLDHVRSPEHENLYTDTKRFTQLYRDPGQFLLADQLIPILMESPQFLSPVNFNGYRGIYPSFDVVEDGSTLFIANKSKDRLRELAIEKLKDTF